MRGSSSSVNNQSSFDKFDNLSHSIEIYSDIVPGLLEVCQNPKLKSLSVVVHVVHRVDAHRHLGRRCEATSALRRSYT